MSTKLYNGIKFKSKNIKEVLDQLISIREAANKIAVDSISDKDLALFIESKNLLDWSALEISSKLKRCIDSERYDDWKYAPRLKFSVVIYPTDEGDIYGYYFNSDIKEFRDLIRPFYTEFHYQDQFEKPYNISHEEWEFREKKWKELIKYKYKNTGLSYDIFTGDDIDTFDLSNMITIVLEKLKREEKINQVIGN